MSLKQIIEDNYVFIFLKDFYGLHKIMGKDEFR
jgi:hypothetical protein